MKQLAEKVAGVLLMTAAIMAVLLVSGLPLLFILWAMGPDGQCLVVGGVLMVGLFVLVIEIVDVVENG